MQLQTLLLGLAQVVLLAEAQCSSQQLQQQYWVAHSSMQLLALHPSSNKASSSSSRVGSLLSAAGSGPTCWQADGSSGRMCSSLGVLQVMTMTMKMTLMKIAGDLKVKEAALASMAACSQG
jgi:hypothetical protein